MNRRRDQTNHGRFYTDPANHMGSFIKVLTCHVPNVMCLSPIRIPDFQQACMHVYGEIHKFKQQITHIVKLIKNKPERIGQKGRQCTHLGKNKIRVEILLRATPISTHVPIYGRIPGYPQDLLKS